MIENFKAGVNLGGWISQYHALDHAHFSTFITEEDIQLIASWGMDHLRLPVDYPVFESDEAPGEYREDGLQYIDNCLEWCRRSGLGVVLDLHHAPGFSFANTLQPETMHLNTLFHEPAAQRRFLDLWQMFARRYRGYGGALVFELMNEVVLPDSAPWNELAGRAVAAIQAVDPSREILIGSNQYNSASQLKNLVVHADPGVQYTFHFYEPLFFTHQKAPWCRECKAFDQTLDYPGGFTNLGLFLEQHPEWQGGYGWQVGRTMDRDLLAEFLQPALDFMAQTGKPLYCGEYGVYDAAPRTSSLRWHADFLDLLRQHGIGRAVWSYKGMGFGLVDLQRRERNAELVALVSKR